MLLERSDSDACRIAGKVGTSGSRR